MRAPSLRAFGGCIVISLRHLVCVGLRRDVGFGCAETDQSSEDGSRRVGRGGSFVVYGAAVRRSLWLFRQLDSQSSPWNPSAYRPAQRQSRAVHQPKFSLKWALASVCKIRACFEGTKGQSGCERCHPKRAVCRRAMGCCF